MTQHGIDVRGRAFEEIEEGTGMEVGLLEVEVQFSALGLGVREVVCQDFGFESLSDGVIELDFSVEGVGGRPSLGEGQAWSDTIDQRESLGLADWEIQALKDYFFLGVEAGKREG
jgi:hypothetical protein